ncbi:MAG: hypothetical protein ACLFTZ_00475 [Acholeplasmataceae bacterium]
MSNLTERIGSWLVRNGRELEVETYRYLYGHGSKESVIEALKTYQNEDGGFAHGLEPDFWTPTSNPIDTWTATNTLRLLDLSPEHEMVRTVLSNLAATPYKEKGIYYFRIPENNAYPHAPWWHYTDENRISGYNPTASLVGFILRHADRASSLYEEAHATFETLIEDFQKRPTDEVHELRCFIELYLDLYDIFDLTELQRKLSEQVERIVDHDENAWFKTYTPTPTQLVRSPETPGYERIKDLLHREIDMIKGFLEQELRWHVTWSWGQYEEAFEKAKKDWESVLALGSLMLLDRFDRA